MTLAVLMLGALAPGDAAHAQTTSDLCSRLRGAATANPGVRASVAVIDLGSQERCGVDAGETYLTASLYKTMLAAEMYRRVELESITLDTPLTVRPDDTLDDPVDMQITEPYTITVGDGIERMITFSDNGSARAMRRMIGQDAVARIPEWLGLESTSLGEEEFVSTPDDQAELYRAIYEGAVVNPEVSRTLLNLLLRQEVNELVPAALPPDTRIAHKTGTYQTVLHDAGIVYAPGGPFVLVVMTESLNYPAAVGVLQSIAATAYQPFAAPRVEEAVRAVSSQPGSAAAGGATTTNEVNPAANIVPVAAVPASDAAQPQAPQGGDSSPTFMLDGPATGTLWTSPALLMALLALAAVAVGVPALRLRRGPVMRYGTDALDPTSDRMRADRSERGTDMRFGSRREDEGRAPAPPHPSLTQSGTQSGIQSGRSAAQPATELPVQPSVRLQRVAEHFRSQGELLNAMRAQFEDEMEPLHELIVQQSRSMQALLENLEDRLRPLNEYADEEEANLSVLEERIRQGGQDHVARSFSSYLDDQRRRISETRHQIDKQREPFLEYGDAQRATVETALARFDSDIKALEENLAEQRRVMMRMLDAMRSETFNAVKTYLAARQATIAEMAADGMIDPTDIGRALASLRRDLEAIAGKSDYVHAILAEAEAADRALIDSAPQPRPLRQEPVAAEAAEDQSETTEAEVSA